MMRREIFEGMTGKTAWILDEECVEVVSFGAIELTRVGNFYFTHTRERYGVNTGGFDPVPAADRSYLLLPWDERFKAENELLARRVTDRMMGVCVLAGDDSRVYWNFRVLADGTVVVLDELGTYYHVTAQAQTGLAVKTCLGRAVTPSEEECIDMKVAELDAEIRSGKQQELLKNREAEKVERMGMLKGLQGALPFQMGSKWGLRNGERIVVPPVYRMVEMPVGCLCAFEKYPGRWGVMELDGRVVIEPNYQKVELGRKNRVKLTKMNGEVMCVEVELLGK